MVLIAEISPPEGLMYLGQNITLKLGDKVIGEGSVYLTRETLAWHPNASREGIIINWKQISVHGITTTPTKCIYFMLDHKVEWEGVYNGGSATNGNGEAANNGLNGGGAAEAIEARPNLNQNNAVVVGNGHVRAAAAAAANGMNRNQNEQAQAANANDIDEGHETDDEEDEGIEAAGGEDFVDEWEMAGTECWLIPNERELHTVDMLFRVMNDCQAFNSDDVESDSNSDESDFMDADDGENGGGLAAAFVADQIHLDHQANNGNAEAAAQGGMRNLSLEDDKRFEDAEE